MKKIRITYNYHSGLYGRFKHLEVAFPIADEELEDVLQEFDLMSHDTHKWDDKFLLLHLIAVVCTCTAYLQGDNVSHAERENIHCITDIEVME